MKLEIFSLLPSASVSSAPWRGRDGMRQMHGKEGNLVTCFEVVYYCIRYVLS